MRAALIVSIALNALLGGAIVAARVDNRTPAALQVDDDAGAAVATFDAGPIEPASYYRSLRDRGLSRDETKPLLLRHLRAVYGLAERHGPEAYWVARGSAALERRIAALDAEGPVRAAILAVYGAHAAADPVFGELFRPLEDRLPFLSSTMQLAVLRARLVDRIEIAKAFEACATRRPAAACRQAGRDGGERLRALHTSLDESTLFEMELRESSLAEQLRNTGVELTEREFRAAFRALTGLEKNPGPGALRDARADLRNLLGERRFDLIWAARDPVFGAVERALRGHGVPVETRLAAYAVVNRAQDELIDAALFRDTDAERAARLARAAVTGERTRLVELLGVELADRLSAERSRTLAQLHDDAAIARP